MHWAGCNWHPGEGYKFCWAVVAIAPLSVSGLRVTNSLQLLSFLMISPFIVCLPQSLSSSIYHLLNQLPILLEAWGSTEQRQITPYFNNPYFHLLFYRLSVCSASGQNKNNYLSRTSTNSCEIKYSL